MTRSAPRIAHVLLEQLERIDDGTLPIAEVHRRLGREAEARGLTRPSYERIRQIVQLTRALKPRRGPSTVEVVLELGAGVRGAENALNAIRQTREDRY